MAGAVTWVFQMLDKVTAPARNAQKRLDLVERTIKRVEAATRLSGGAFGGWAKAGENSARRVEAAFSRVQNRVGQTQQGLQNAAQTLGMVGFAAAGVGYGAVRAGGAVLNGMGQREGNLGSLGTFLKGRTPAQIREAQNYIDQFADITPFEDLPVNNAIKQLLGYKFSWDETKGIARITGDAASARGNSIEEAAQIWESANRALGQIRAKGRVQQDELLQLSEAGLTPYEYLDKYVGKNWRQLSEKGQLSASVGISAILRGLQDDFGGSMDKKSKEFMGLWSTVKSRPQRILGNMFDQGALDQPKKLLENLVELTDFNKPPGSRILARVTRLGKRAVDGLFGPLASATSGQRGIDTVDRLLDKLDEYATWWEREGPRVIANAKGFGEGLAAGVNTALIPVKLLGAGLDKLDRLTGGEGSGGMGKVLGFMVGAGGVAWLANLLSFGMIGKLGMKGGQMLIGAMKTGIGRAGQAILGRSWLARTFMGSVRGGGLIAALGLKGLGPKLLGGLKTLGPRMLGWLGKLAPLAARFVPWLARIGALFAGLSNPIGWVITAVTAIAGLGAILYRKWEPFRDFIDGLGDKFREAAQSAVQWFQSIPSQLAGLGAKLYEILFPQWVRDALAKVKIYLPTPQVVQQAAAAVPTPAPPAPRTSSLTPAGASASVTALIGVAQRLGIDPQALLAVAFKESSLNPAAAYRDKQGNVKAAGLIQFTGTTAGAYGLTLDRILKMSPAEQAPYIERYLREAGVQRGASLEQVYAAVFAGNANKTGRVLYTTADGKAYSDNKGLDLNSDGQITSMEAAQSAGSAWSKAAPTFAPNITINAYGQFSPQFAQDVGAAAGSAMGNTLDIYAREQGAGVPGGVQQ